MSTLYHPQELRAWTNTRGTKFKIHHRKSDKVLWSGTSKDEAEAWLREHLIPPMMPKNKLAEAVTNALKLKT